MHYQPKSQLFLEEYNINNTFRVVKFDTLKETRTTLFNVCQLSFCSFFKRKKCGKDWRNCTTKKTCSFFLWQDNANNELYVKLRTCALPSSSIQSYMAFVVLFTFLQLHSLFFLLRFFSWNSSCTRIWPISSLFVFVLFFVLFFTHFLRQFRSFFGLTQAKIVEVIKKCALKKAATVYSFGSYCVEP